MQPTLTPDIAPAELHDKLETRIEGGARRLTVEVCELPPTIAVTVAL